MGLGSSNSAIVDVCLQKKENAFCDANLKIENSFDQKSWYSLV